MIFNYSKQMRIESY